LAYRLRIKRRDFEIYPLEKLGACAWNVPFASGLKNWRRELQNRT